MLSLLTPAFNEAENLPRILGRLRAACASAWAAADAGLDAPAHDAEVLEREVVEALAPSGGSVWSTGRNRSSAVLPTRRCALVRSRTPGRSTMMRSPCRLISGSATPSESTRAVKMRTVSLS